MAKANIRIWAYHHTSDPVTSVFNTRGFINNYNASTFKVNDALLTEIAANNHGGWFQAYDPTYRPSILGSKNVFEWMLQFFKPE